MALAAFKRGRGTVSAYGPAAPSDGGDGHQLDKQIKTGVSTEIVLAVSSSSKDPIGDTTCSKCKRPVLPAEVTAAGPRCKQVVHRRCVTAYKRRMRMNKKNKALKLAWEALDEAGQVDWFAKNTVDDVEVNSKRNIEHSLEQVSEEMNTMKVRRVAIPKSKFTDEGLMKGWSSEKVETEWRRMLLEPGAKVVSYQGQQLLSRFEGVVYDEETRGGAVSRMSMTKAVGAQLDLAASLTEAQSFIATAHASNVAFGANIHSGFFDSASSIPDHLVDGLIDVEDTLPAKTIEGFMKFFRNELEAEERRDETLQRLLQDDLFDASFYKAEHEVEEAETEDDLAKYRIAKKNDLHKLYELTELSVGQVGKESAEVLASAKQKLGADSAQAQEAYLFLADHAEKLAVFVKEYKVGHEALVKAFDDGNKIVECKHALQKAKEFRAEKLALLGTYKRSNALLRALIRKHESLTVRGVKSQVQELQVDDGARTENTSEELIQHLVNHVLVQDGNPINSSVFVEPFDRTKPLYIMNDGLKTFKSDVKFISSLSTWLLEQMDKRCTMSAPLEKSQHMNPILSFLKEKGECCDAVFEKPHSVLHACVASVFSMSIVRANNEMRTYGFAAYGVGMWHCVVEGSLLICGVKAEHVPGGSFNDKIREMQGAKPDAATKLIKEHGFCMKVEPGSMCWVPAGYIHMIATVSSAAVWLKWASLAANPLTDDLTVARTILSAATSMVASFPTLGVQYRDWLKYLEVSTTVAITT